MTKLSYTIISLAFIFFFGLTSNVLSAQFDANGNKWFTNLEDALSEADRVFKLDLSGQGLKEIPKELAAFPNLIELRIMDNLISSVGTELSENTRNTNISNCSTACIWVVRAHHVQRKPQHTPPSRSLAAVARLLLAPRGARWAQVSEAAQAGQPGARPENTSPAGREGEKGYTALFYFHITKVACFHSQEKHICLYVF